MLSWVLGVTETVSSAIMSIRFHLSHILIFWTRGPKSANNAPPPQKKKSSDIEQYDFGM